MCNSRKRRAVKLGNLYARKKVEDSCTIGLSLDASQGRILENSSGGLVESFPPGLVILMGFIGFICKFSWRWFVTYQYVSIIIFSRNAEMFKIKFTCSKFTM